MNQDYPIEIGRFSRRRRLRSVPYVTEGRSVGIVSSGIRMPESGSFYVVEFDSSSASRVRLLGYIDRFGRGFTCDAPLEAPPAKMPQFLVAMRVDKEGDEGTISVQLAGRTFLTQVMGFRRTGRALHRSKFSFMEAKGPARQAGIDLSGCPQGMPYADFMAICFLSLYAVLCDSQSGLAPSASSQAFDLSELCGRLTSTDVFSGIEREVLEYESSWQANPGSARGIERYLVRMLREEGAIGRSPSDFAVPVEGMDGLLEPSMRLIRTAAYANTFYIDFSYSLPSMILEDGLLRAWPEVRAQRAALIGIEGALNRFLLLAEYLEEHGTGQLDEDEGACGQCDQGLIDRICVQAPDPRSPRPAEGRWGLCLAFARLCEGLRLPYRIGYDFRTTAAADAVAVNVVMPPVASLPKTQWNRETGAFEPVSDECRDTLHARYAAHATLLVAAAAFHASAQVDRVLVACQNAEMDFSTLIAASFDRERFEDAFSSDADFAFVDPFSVLSDFGARYRFGSGCALEPVEPLFSFKEGEFALGREPLVCNDATPFGAGMRRMVGVDLCSDLNIFEERDRRSLADEITSSMGEGGEGVIETIKSVHDRSENITVRRVCRGLLDDFESGRLDAHSELEVREAFLDAYGFKGPMTRAASLFYENDGAGAIDTLEGLETLVNGSHAFADSSLICHRYFDSYATRVLYEKLCGDDRRNRKVLPLPNEAYLVHDLSAQLLTNSIAGHAEGLRHARRCIELSPAYATAYLRVARAHFSVGDFQSEAEMCIEALRRAWDPEDVGLALYWLAFAFWRLDKFELAVACYRRCMALGGGMAQQAAEEFDELIGDVKGLQMHTASREHEMLLEAGVPIDAPRENAEFLLKVAQSAVDAGADALGSVLVTSAMRIVKDDALLPVLRAIHP